MWKKRLLNFIVLVSLSLLFIPVAAISPVQASWFDDSSDKTAIVSALAIPTPTIEDYELNKADLDQFYKARDYKPAWDTSSRNGRSILSLFLTSVSNFANFHGLPVSDYPTSLIGRRINIEKDGSDIGLELLITEYLIRLSKDLHGDTRDMAQLHTGWPFHRDPIDLIGLLGNAVKDKRVSDFIVSLAPANPDYVNLTKALKIYREMEQKGPWPTIPSGPIIRLNDKSPRVAAIRQRLAAENYIPQFSMPEPDTKLYDSALMKAVIDYQTRNGLKADGHVGNATIAAMNVPITDRVNQIIANMERWRHMPESFLPRSVRVNIASATMDVFEDNKPIYHGLVIAGRPDRKTPFINSNIRSVIFNPSWHVPAKIARKDILPKLREDPHYLEKMGFVINGSADDPHGDQIDWNKIEESEFNFRLRQSPGDLNSLGRLKFDFDNDYAVYMHGTPHQELFAKPERNLSSGCVRLEDPIQFAEMVLSRNNGEWSIADIKQAIDARKTRWLKVKDPLPLMIVYWTVFTGDDGAINFRDDVYDYDKFLIERLNGK